MLHKLLILIFVVLFAFITKDSSAELPADTKVTNSGKVVNYETQGNLEVKNKIDCESFAKLNNKLTPADLYNGMSDCFISKNYENATQLFILAGVFGRFDVQRVADPTAHQAISVMQMQVFQNLSDEQRSKFKEAIEKYLSQGSPQLVDTCEKVRQIGAPEYYPRYMIQHGIRAFGAEQANQGLVSDFQPKVAWNKSLDTYLHCPKK